MKGRVIKSTGSWYQVRTDFNQVISCRVKGKLRLNITKLTNPIAVGDIVEFEIEDSGDGIINKLHDRENYLIRRSNKLSSQYQIIASNVDQIVLLATIVKPRTTTIFIDRILLAAQAYHIPVLILFNKCDLYSLDEHKIKDEWKELYESIGYKVLSITASNSTTVTTILPFIENKISLITGHSGVGKSTLMNQLNPNLKLKTGGLSKYHQRGTHNTTFAEMHSINNDTFIIDTPGIKDFGIVDFESDNVSLYFKEISTYAKQCKFNNCLHIDEPGCKVMEALHNNLIYLSRYESYLNVLSSIHNQ